MHELRPFLRLYKSHWFGLSLGIILAFLTLSASIGLLTLSGWFIAASAVAGALTLTQFNYMLPAAGVRGFSIARTAGRWGERVVSHNATFKLLADLRIAFFDQLAPLIPGNIANIRDADMLNRLVADVNAMDHVYLRLISPLVVCLFSLLGISTFLYIFEPILGVILGVILLLLTLFLPIIFYYLGKPHGESITLATSQLRITLLDWLSGHAELKIYNADARYRENINQAEIRLLNAQARMASITGLASAVLMAANGITLVLMIWLAATHMEVTQHNPYIAMVAFLTMASFELMAPIAGAFQYLSQTKTSARRLNDILGTEPVVHFLEHGHQETAKGNITLSTVHFTYPTASQQTLQGIDLQITSGSHVAFLGKTGCGKSTLAQLLTRAWDPNEGQIFLDGIPLTQWQEANLRQAIAVVSQRIDLFNGTLRSNLQLANTNASDSEFIKVLTDVNLGYLAENNGLNAWIGDGGRQLSGGEKRRIGIARALLHDAPILLLDEPTEGLDPKTEKAILDVIFQHAKGKTLLLITHKLTQLTEMDCIYLMENGKIVEQGNHDTLRQAGGYYHRLLKRIMG